MNQHVPSSVEYVKERSLHYCELLRDRLYFATLSDVNLKSFIKKSSSNVHYLFVDNDFVYQAFNQDFGPLNLGMLYLYCKKVNTIFKKKSIIIHLTSIEKEKRANAAFLVGSYCIIYHQMQPNEVITRLKELSTSYLAYKNFAPFVHAGFDACRYHLYLEDCFAAIQKAIKCKFLDFSTFNLKDYQFYEKVENGDLNWIVPNKFIAFCDPQTYSGSSSNTIDFYVKYFQTHNVTTIIRLNKSTYDAKRFVEKGFKHHDLIFMDGSAPSDYLMREFLNICESTTGAIAVHCKAGLGRTGTLIACYIMKHYKFTAPEATAWTRICRPGSIIGYQQKWLERKQNILWAQGDLFYDNNLPGGVPSITAAAASNGSTISSEDGVNNNLEINIVKCRISNTGGAKDYANDVANANQITSGTTSNHDKSKLVDKLIAEFDSINFDEVAKSGSNRYHQSSRSQATYTQGDYLNEIKLNRKKNTVSGCKNSGCTAATTRPSVRTCVGSSSNNSSNNNNTATNPQLRVVKLDPNNNFPMVEHKSCNVAGSSATMDSSSLKLYGKKMNRTKRLRMMNADRRSRSTRRKRLNATSRRIKRKRSNLFEITEL